MEQEQWEIDLRAKLEKELPDETIAWKQYRTIVGYIPKQEQIEFQVAVRKFQQQKQQLNITTP